MSRLVSPVCNSFDTSETSTETSNIICAYPLAINHIKFGPQLTPQEGSYHQTIMEEHMPDGHPSRYYNAPYCCLTSTSRVPGLLPLSCWDKKKVQVGTQISILYPNASLGKPNFTQWQGC